MEKINGENKQNIYWGWDQLSTDYLDLNKPPTD